MQLHLQHIRKTFGATVALDDISFSATAPEFVCLLGPSGCGKTTLLRLIAGLARPDAGEMRLDGMELTRIPARERGFGIVFQAYSLFPNMRVADNIGYGLTIRGVPKQISLPVTFLGHAIDPWGNARLGFEAETTINRKDFGLMWNAALETGGFLVGDDVKVSLNIEANAQ